MTSALLILAAGLLLLAAAAVDHAPAIGRRVVLSARGGWRPRRVLASRPPAPDQGDVNVLVGGHPERGTDHDDATAAEVLAVFDALAADAYPRITVLEDDTEIPLALPAVRPVRVRHGAGWPAAPVRPLVLVRCPVGGAW